MEIINEWIWGFPMLLLLLGVGGYLSCCTGFVQIRLLFPSLRRFVEQLLSKEEADGSQLRALCTALAATVGTGNIAGVAGAIAIGGPGAVFWMWVSGFVGMATKYAEAVLAVRYRQKNALGDIVGGPMYIIRNGLGAKFASLAGAYACCGMVAAMGVGNTTQINALMEAAEAAAESFGRTFSPQWKGMVGLGIAALVYAAVSGGAPKIGSVAEALVPFASIIYILLCLGVIAMRLDVMGRVMEDIITGAFSPAAVTGGAVGSAVVSMRLGISRGVFSNEAGMGTAAMAHAGANVQHPVQQGMMGIMEVFLDTIVICTMTALVILASGVGVPFGESASSELTAMALTQCYGPWVTIMLSLCLCCFAFATILGWGLYAGRCVEYLFGKIHWRTFAMVQTGGIILGALLGADLIWSFSEMVNGLMAIPNLTALFLLSGQVRQITQDFDRKRKGKKPAGFPEGNVV